jgi:hypothetical protein
MVWSGVGFDVLDLEVVICRDVEARAPAALVFERDKRFPYSDLFPYIEIDPTPHFLSVSLDDRLELSPLGFRHFGDGCFVGGRVHGGEAIQGGEFAAIEVF